MAKKPAAPAQLTANQVLIELLRKIGISITEHIDSTIEALEELGDGADLEGATDAEEAGDGEEPEQTAEEILDSLSDDELKDLTAHLKVKGRSAKAIRQALVDLGADALNDALDELFPEEGGEEDGEGDDFGDIDVDDLSDDEVKDLAKHLEVKGRTAKALRDGLKKLDQDAINEAYDEVFPEDDADGGKGDKGEVNLDTLQELAAKLLKAGERRTLKSILDEVGVKALSAAKPKDFGALFDALDEAVSAL